MKTTENVHLNPIAVEKTLRTEEVRVLTSGRAGKILPLKFIPVLREDRVTKGSVRVTVDMAETIHPLMNAVNLTVYAHFVPYLALEAFKEYGMDTFNRSYMQKPEPGVGGTQKPFIRTHAFDRDIQFYKTLGIHHRQGDVINGLPLETFRELVNFRRKARSEHLPEYDPTLGQGLPAAFWKHGDMMQVVPSFDQAAMDGEVELTFNNSRVPLRSQNFQVVDPGDTGRVPMATDGFQPFPDGNGWYSWAEQIFVELSNSNVSVSLANIEVAKKTAAFAKLRDRYNTIDEDHIIDLLMMGIRVPDEALKQPILLDKKSTIFGYQERHAMDGASLEKSVTTGNTSVDLQFRLPESNTGGIIWITAEIVPEQLFERKWDYFLSMEGPAGFPEFLRDYLDPEKVTVVPNRFADVNHSNPSGVFGYAPLNHEWRRNFANIGGKFYRPTPDSFVEDRQRFWAVEQIDPSLTADFYLTNDLPHSVFMDTLSDAFEILCTGQITLMGNTVFGKSLEEDQDNYNYINMRIDRGRIDQNEE